MKQKCTKKIQNVKYEDPDFRTATIAADIHAPCLICHDKATFYGSYTLYPWVAIQLGLRPGVRVGYGLCDACAEHMNLEAVVGDRIVQEIRKIQGAYPAFTLYEENTVRIGRSVRNPISMWN